MPALSPTMTQGNIAKWVKKEGDKVTVGSVIAEVETDKATVAFESVEEGYLAKILVSEGSKDVPVGRLVAILVDTPEAVAAFKDYKDSPSSAAPAAKPTAPVTPAAPAASAPQPAAPQPAAASKPLTGALPHLSPAVAHIVLEHSIDPRSITGTGKAGRILKGDVLAALKSGNFARAAPPSHETPSATPSAPKAAAPAAAPAAKTSAPQGKSLGRTFQRTHSDSPNTQVRRVIASRLTQSKQNIPHTYMSKECALDTLLQFRKQLQDQYTAAGSKNKPPSVNDFVILAAAKALRAVPDANVRWDEASSSAVQFPTVDISVAVATPTGLITPIVKNADKQRLDSVASIVRDLAARARDNKLKPEEFVGGSFTISNLGMFGTDVFSAVINPPQACILAVGSSTKRIVLSEPITNLDEDPKPEPPAPKSAPSSSGAAPSAAPVQTLGSVKTFMAVTLSFDGRAVGEDTAARFLQAFDKFISNPSSMLL